MALFKAKSNKKFNYTPRYYNHDGDGSPFKITNKFDRYRTTLETPKGLKGKFAAALADYKDTPATAVNKRVFLIAVVLLFIFLCWINFDFSIFNFSIK